MLTLLCYLLAAPAVLLLLYAVQQKSTSGKGRAAVVVIGDYGRSPRMQYHTVSLGKMCKEVFVVGMKGSNPCEDVKNATNINLTLLMGEPKVPQGMPWVVRTALRLTIQLLRIPYIMFWKLPKCGVVVLQNPPAVPILPIAVLACKLRGMKLVVDWHNLGYTLMEMDNRPKPAIKAYKFVERWFGKQGNHHLCVCKSLQGFLEGEWGMFKVTEGMSSIMYDHAPAFFTREGPGRWRTLVDKGLGEIIRDKDVLDSFVQDGKWKSDRPALLVTGTSWTVDEDVGMLIQALAKVDGKLGENGLPSKLVMVITGKGGALKEQREREIAELGLKNVFIYTGFLKSIGDYASMLGVADLGISLHNSSSGYDLPMKVVDMFGTSLPVLALGFPTLAELVTPSTGTTFQTLPDLTASLVDLLTSWSVDPSDRVAATPLLQRYRQHLIDNPHGSWDAEWNAKTKPVVENFMRNV